MNLSHSLRRVRQYLRRGRVTPLPRKPMRRLELENLETRLAPACTFTTGGGVITFNCDNAVDYLLITHTPQFIQVQANGALHNFTWGVLNSLIINTGGGADDIRVEKTALGRPVTLNGQSGTDSVLIGLPGSGVQQIQGTVTVTNAASYTDLHISDVGNAAPRPATLGATSLIGLAPASINWVENGVRLLDIQAGSGADTFRVVDTPLHGGFQHVTLNTGVGAGGDHVQVERTTGPLFIKGNSGNDTVHVGDPWAGGSVQQIQGTVQVSNLSGHTALTVTDTISNVPRTVSLNSSTLVGLAPAVIQWLTGDLLSLTVNGGTGADTYTVFNTPAGASVTLNTGGGADTVHVRGTNSLVGVNTGAGADTVNVGNNGDVLDAIDGALTVNGQTDTDTLVLNDQGSVAAYTYTLTASTLSRPGAAQIAYAGFDGLSGLTLRAGSGGDTLYVRGTATPTAVHAGGGNDTIHVGSAANSLGTFLAGLTLNGGNQTDTVNLNDQGTAGGREYFLGAGGVATLNTAQIHWSFVEGVVLNATSGYDDVIVQSTAAGTPMTLNMGVGNDAVTVDGSGNRLDTILAMLTVNGGPGTTDTLTLRDTGSVAGTAYTFGGGAIYVGATQLFQVSNLEAVTLHAGDFDDIFAVVGNTPGATVNLHGRAGTDTIMGGSSATAFHVAGPNAGFMGTLPAGYANTFTSVENLLGSTDSDQFTVAHDSTVSGWIIGGDGTDTLSYAAYGADVLVNMPLYTATQVGGFIYQIENALGGAGNDILVGDDASNRLVGGAGRDLLIGGGWSYLLQPDTLEGGGGEDILIGGYTAFDYDAGTLSALRDVWAGPGDYAARTSLMSVWLNAATVFYNYASTGNRLTGGADLDWFFGNTGEDNYDWDELDEIFIPVF